MLVQGACVDSFGVGERMITSSSHPVFGGVYKLSGVEDAKGNITPKIKISENVTKITTPGFKKIYRLYDRETNKAIADVITLHNETIDDSKPCEIFDPDFIWKKKTVTNFRAVEIREQIMRGGQCVAQEHSLKELQEFCRRQVDMLWDEVKRFENPHRYYVDLSPKLWDLKNRLISKYSG
jgi:nicotinate phosphoribosyltransferase